MVQTLTFGNLGPANDHTIINQLLPIKRAGQGRDERLIKIAINLTRRCAGLRTDHDFLGSAFADFQGHKR